MKTFNEIVNMDMKENHSKEEINDYMARKDEEEKNKKKPKKKKEIFVKMLC